MEEISVALSEMESTKAPGPDGFNAGWIKKLWPQIKDQVFVFFFQEFYKNANIPSGANSSFFVLIPKIRSPEHVNDFRPISLINVQIKLLLKVLENRLKFKMSKVISEDLFSFIQGRNINESIMVVNEVLHSVKN